MIDMTLSQHLVVAANVCRYKGQIVCQVSLPQEIPWGNEISCYRKSELFMKKCNSCVYPDLKCHSSSIALFFHGGPAYEEAKQNGISHLLEHMFFRRLDKWNQEELYTKINEMGGILQGSTSFDCLLLTLTTASQHFQKAIHLMSKVLLPFQWTEAEITAEKEVVIAQINKRGYQYRDYFDDLYFGRGKYAQRIMGSVKSVKSIDAEDLNAWKKKVVSHGNFGVIVSGNLTEYSIDYSVFEKIAVEGSRLPNRTKMPFLFQNRTTADANHIEVCEGDICDVTLLFDIDTKVENGFHVDLLSSMIAGGDGAILQKLLRGIVDEYDIYSEIEKYEKFSRLRISYGVSESHIEESIHLLFELFCPGNQIDMETELEKNKLFFTDNFRDVYDDPQKLNYEVGYRKFILKQKLYLVEDLIQEYEAVTPDKIMNTYQSVFQSKNMSVFISAPNHLEKIEALVNHYRAQMNGGLHE